MKKKTFIVQLLNSKKPSRTSFTQVEDANFYSNDTDASLVFIPHEDSFDFQSAKVVMFNRGDESLVERDMEVTTEDGRKVASYELPDEIISHWGQWIAQPVFIIGDEIYSGAIVPFSVERHLMHERPPKLTEVITVTKFVQQSQELVNAMIQAEAQRITEEQVRQSSEENRVQAESERSVKYESYAQQFNDVITDLSEEKDYHSLPEISAARGGHDTLGDRLDETTTQLAQTDNEIIQARGGETTLQSRLDRDLNRIKKSHTERGIDPKDFGVVADGVTDDTVAMQAVINHAIATKSIIYLTGVVNIVGTLLINHSFENRDPVVFSGNGMFKKMNSGYLFNSTSSRHSGNVRFNGVRFRSNVGAGTEILNPKMLIRVYFYGCDFVNVDHLMTSVGSDYAQTIYLLQCTVTGGKGFFIDLGTAYDVSFLQSVCEHRDALYRCPGTAYSVRINNNVIEGMTGRVAEIGAGYNYSIKDNYFERNTTDSLDSYIHFTFGVPGNTGAVIDNNLFADADEKISNPDFSFIYAIAMDDNIKIINNSHNGKLLEVLQEKSLRPNILADLMTNKSYEALTVNNYPRTPIEMGTGNILTGFNFKNLVRPTDILPNTNVSMGSTNPGIYIRVSQEATAKEVGFKTPPIKLMIDERVVVGLDAEPQSYALASPQSFVTIFDSSGEQVYRENTRHVRNVANIDDLNFVSLPSFKVPASGDYTVQVSLYKDTPFTFDDQFLLIRNLYLQYGTIATKSS